MLLISMGSRDSKTLLDLTNLTHLPQRHIAPMRESIRNLVGEITLRPKVEGYLEAQMVGRYKGLLKLAVGRALNNVGCGGSILAAFLAPLRIALK